MVRKNCNCATVVWFITNFIFLENSIIRAVGAFLTSPSSVRTKQQNKNVRDYLGTTIDHKISPPPPTSLTSSTSTSRYAISEIGTEEKLVEDEEWYPRDPAFTTSQLLAGLWFLIKGGSTMVKGETDTIIFPQMEDKLNNPKFMNVLMAHLDSCKDVCDHFGITTTLVPYREKNKITGFTVKSYRNPGKDSNAYEFDYDPFWDDPDMDIPDYSGIDDEIESEEMKKKDLLPEIVNKIPDNDDELINTTKVWVKTVMSNMGICPFTSGAELAGIPMGPVYYCVDRSSSVEEMYARYWKEVCRIEHEKENDISTTLLIAPEFYIDNIELFETWSNSLTQPLSALGIESLLQLVFFHPNWSFRDGGARSSEGEAANYARRSPWPMINILRTKQVRLAQKAIPTGLVYKQNEKTLGNIGVQKLETMLRLRDWDGVSDIKVNRREIEALRIAQDYQETGIVNEEDTSVVYDATPAANKADKGQLEHGNLVNVLCDALQKRLGINENGKTAAFTQLSGPETSVTIMASDFLIKELISIIKKSSSSNTATEEEKAEKEIEKQKLASDQRKKKSIEAAKRALLADFDEPSSIGMGEQRGSEELDVMFGKGGISLTGDSDDDEEDSEKFSSGNDPRSFF